jgi:hypothetical protein
MCDDATIAGLHRLPPELTAIRLGLDGPVLTATGEQFTDPVEHLRAREAAVSGHAPLTDGAPENGSVCQPGTTAQAVH